MVMFSISCAQNCRLVYRKRHALSLSFSILSSLVCSCFINMLCILIRFTIFIFPVGRVQVKVHPRIDSMLTELIESNSDIQAGGAFEPNDCYFLHRVAIIIPYRDRYPHLATLLYHLHPILQRQLLSYKIYVIEQVRLIRTFFHKKILLSSWNVFITLRKRRLARVGHAM